MLTLRPVSLRDAKPFITEHHRHSEAPHAWKFGVGVTETCQSGIERETDLVGVGVAARPCRELDDGYTLTIVRTCTTGTPNACSMIYGALVRAGRALGYKRFYSYTVESEDGASLRAAGFVPDGKVRAQTHYLLICHDPCYLDHTTAHGNGTHVVTIKGRTVR